MTGLGIDGIVRIAAAVFAVFVGASVRTVVVAAVAGLTLVLWRRAATRTRSRVWTLVLYAALAMPILARVTPVLRFDVPAMSAMTTLGHVSGSSVALGDEASAWLGSTSVFEATSAGSSGPVRPAIPWMALALAVYVAGIAWLLTRMVVGWVVARRLDGSGTPIADPRVLDRVAVHSARLGLIAPPRLIEHARLFVPIAMAVRGPVIGLPADWREWADGTLDAVLLHEISHVARGDTLTLWLSQIYRACAWMNPLSWWLHTRLSDLAEEASDETALESGINRTAYAETLLTFLARLPGTAERAAWQHVAMARPDGRGAERRIDRVLTWDRQASRAQGRRTQAVVMVTVTLIVGVAASVRLTAGDFPSAPRILPLHVNPVSSPSRGPSIVTLTEPTGQARKETPGASTTRPSSPAAVTSPGGAAVPSGLQQAPAPIADGFGAGAYKPGTGVTLPTLLHKVDARYSVAAMARRLQGDAELQAVVLADGTVGDVRVSKSLDSLYGLDDMAVRATRQWLFSPGLVDGGPAPILITVLTTFRLDNTKASPEAAPVAYVPEPLADAFANGAYWSSDVGVVAPQVLQAVVPKYTAQAMRDKLQGVVEVEVVVQPDGSVGNVRVLRSIDPVDGLDDNAIAAVRQTTFTPGTLNGQPVSVLTTLELNFRLH
jgi:TonB family protein